MQQLGQNFRGKSEKEICTALMNSANFGTTMRRVRARSQTVDLASSRNMYGVVGGDFGAPEDAQGQKRMGEWKGMFYHEKPKQQAVQKKAVGCPSA